MTIISIHNTQFLIGAGSLTALAILWMTKWRRNDVRLPPGPPLDPFIGGLRRMPSMDQWVVFKEWTQKWGALVLFPLPSKYDLDGYLGDVIYTTICGKPVIILNSIDAARDLFDKRSANYSDRPRLVAFNEM